MLDGNTVAERLHDAANAKADAVVEAYEKEAVESIVDDLMDGDKVGQFTRHDFLNCISDDDLAAILFAKSRDEQQAAIDACIQKVRQDILDWCAASNNGQDQVNDRCAELNEADYYRFREDA